jgi:hypothetical protein
MSGDIFLLVGFIRVVVIIFHWHTQPQALPGAGLPANSRNLFVIFIHGQRAFICRHHRGVLHRRPLFVQLHLWPYVFSLFFDLELVCGTVRWSHRTGRNRFLFYFILFYFG